MGTESPQDQVVGGLGPLRGVSHRSLVQEAMVEVKEGLFGLFGTQGSQYVCVQAAELERQRASRVLSLPAPNHILP